MYIMPRQLQCKVNRLWVENWKFCYSSVGSASDTVEREFEPPRRKNFFFHFYIFQVLKVKIKEMFQRICRLEGDKYDLEERRTRQEYDLKELNERQRQIARAKALKKGMNPDQIETGPHPVRKIMFFYWFPIFFNQSLHLWSWNAF